MGLVKFVPRGLFIPRVETFLVGAMQVCEAPLAARAIGRRGRGTGELESPWGVAVDGEGNVIVSDWDKHCIVIFTAAGGVVRVFGREGSGAGELKFPAGVAVDGEGNVFVADRGNSRIVVLSAAGNGQSTEMSARPGSAQTKRKVSVRQRSLIR